MNAFLRSTTPGCRERRYRRFAAAAGLAALLALGVPRTGAAPATPPNPATRTNAPALGLPKAPATNRPSAVPLPGRPGGTNVSVAKAAGTNSPAGSFLSGLDAKYRQFKAHPAFWPAVIGAATLAIGLIVFFVARSRKKPGADAGSAGPALASQRAKKKQGKVHSCNVLQIDPGARELYQFEARTAGFALAREQTIVGDAPLPARLVQKDWRALFQRKLNVACLPSEHVFLRVAQLPASDLDETLSMVEFQLEKLSPMPVNQVVWSMHPLPGPAGDMQTVILIIVARNIVEEFLGRLEGQGYMADRLELPLLDQIQATPFDRDGAWIYPETSTGRKTAVVAWTSGGAVQNIDLLNLPETGAPASAREQLLQMAWAGELEGWLKTSPEWTVVGEGAAAAEWEALLREGLDQSVRIVAPAAGADLAALTARRAAQADPRVNLVPPEFATRYQQIFVDRLWMRGLGALVSVYLIGVLVYFVAVQFALFRTRSVENEVVLRGPTYTNALQLKEQYAVLKDRQELKYAALDCWNAVATLLPEGLVLDRFVFSRGKELQVSGTAPTSQTQDILKFEGELRKVKVNDQRLFTDKGESTSTRANPNAQGGPTVTWSFKLELRRAETL